MEIFLVAVVNAVGMLLAFGVGYGIGARDGDRDGYVRGYKDGTHGRTFKRVREGGAY